MNCQPSCREVRESRVLLVWLDPLNSSPVASVLDVFCRRLYKPSNLGTNIMKYQWFGAIAISPFVSQWRLFATLFLSISASSFWDCGVPRASAECISSMDIDITTSMHATCTRSLGYFHIPVYSVLGTSWGWPKCWACWKLINICIYIYVLYNHVFFVIIEKYYRY